MNRLMPPSVLSRAFTVALIALSGHAVAQGIYSCVDDKGRKLTSDRPINECMDRAQKELNPSGTIRRVITPPLTSKDKAAQEEKERADVQARLKQAEEKRRDRTLLTRYPNRATHDNARAAALARVKDVSGETTKRSPGLAEQRKSILTELAFYKDAPGQIPPALKRRLDDIDSQIADQTSPSSGLDAEKNLINQRFDDELAKLKPQWAVTDTVETSVTAKKP